MGSRGYHEKILFVVSEGEHLTHCPLVIIEFANRRLMGQILFLWQAVSCFFFSFNSYYLIFKNTTMNLNSVLKKHTPHPTIGFINRMLNLIISNI